MSTQSRTRKRAFSIRARRLPGLRLAQKYAVRVGGGANQRLALYDGILIKENHIAAAGGVGAAMDAALALNAGVSIQIEVETLEQLETALAHRAQSILLDNFSFDAMRDAVRYHGGAGGARGVWRRELRDRADDRGNGRRPRVDWRADQRRARNRLLDADRLSLARLSA